ncbi:phosphopentomutase [bacterium]|nr:phosphopentomutase [bacterium]
MGIINSYKAILIILDGVGIGELPDASEYGDQGSNTLANTAELLGGLNLPNLRTLGLGNIHPLKGIQPVKNPMGAFGKMAELSTGKDSTSGHWELMGLISKQPLPTYPDGFPPEIISRFTAAIGRGILGNYAQSGTEIINQLGNEHLSTGKPIVYTSADSVFQIAAHLDIITLEKLYEWCEIARGILVGDHGVGRVIARPFTGKPGHFIRTPDRKDFSLHPPGDTVMDSIKAAGMPVVGIGKIYDLFNGKGLTESYHTTRNTEGIEKTIQFIASLSDGLIFTNLGDFDTIWGHRNNPTGFAQGLLQFDQELPRIYQNMGEHDLLIITADHGNDPTTPSTDHSREYVPLLAYCKSCKGLNLGVRRSFADVGASLAEFLKVKGTGQGNSFLKEIYD